MGTSYPSFVLSRLTDDLFDDLISSSGKKCGYTDDKAELEGNVNDGWVFFPLKDVGTMSTAYAKGGGDGSGGGRGIVGFCADFPKPKEARLKDFEVLVLVSHSLATSVARSLTHRVYRVSALSMEDGCAPFACSTFLW